MSTSRDSLNSRGIALITALFVMMIMSILAIGLLTNVDDELKMSKSVENSERALEIAEAGVQIARSKFFNPSAQIVNQTIELSSVDGFYRGGYFLTQLQSGFQGEEKWTQWRYDGKVSGNNVESEITVPLYRVWATGNLGVNGFWDTPTRFFATNLYAIVAGGTYFSIQSTTGDTLIRAHDEYTGKQKVTDVDETTTYWLDDKSIAGSYNVNTASWMSSIASFSNFDSTKSPPEILSQTLYFTYAGSNTPISSTQVDTTTTVRLRAVNALCNNTADGNPANSLWEFDTNLHGIGTSPTVFDPDPNTAGDEIIYFAVVAMGDSANPLANRLDLNQQGSDTFLNYPNKASDGDEQIYLFAIVDITQPNVASPCSPTNPDYVVKWAHSFPDPEVVRNTTYPTGHYNETAGQTPPYVHSAANMEPFLPEQDLLPDYRDGEGESGAFNNDGQRNLVRGNIAHKAPPACSAPLVSVLYQKANGDFTEKRQEAKAESQTNPRIDIYLMYTARSRVAFYRSGAASPMAGSSTVETASGNNWGPPGERKPNTVQARLISIRDRLVASSNGWDWNAPASRYPTFKWSYRLPAHDPDETDARPWDGYGEYTWDTWFMQQVTPVIKYAKTDQSRREWATIAGDGSANLYPVIYTPYRSDGFVTGSGYINDNVAGRAGPNLNQGSPTNFTRQSWTDSRVMIMAVRDTWDDYMAGNQTNYLYDDMVTQNNPMIMPQPSNPFEPYWVHDHNDYSGSGGSNTCNAFIAGCPPNAYTYAAYPSRTVITYNMTANDTAGNLMQMPFPANASKVGFPRPYRWSEGLWDANVRDESDNTMPWSMYRQGWQGAGFSPSAGYSSGKNDIRGESPAMCAECLREQGLLVFPFTDTLTSRSGRTMEYRLHAINATTGRHEWDFHANADYASGGDNFNGTPAIANDIVFAAYKSDGARTVMLETLNADDGRRRQMATVVDNDADALILSPSIANGGVYIGTYTHGQNLPSSVSNTQNQDDFIRLFALSPVIRLVSTGIYPVDDTQYTGNAFRNITLLDHDTMLKDTGEAYLTGQGKVPTSKRKLQVWVTGSNSKWEEVREAFR
ncbi:hypothetical protein CSB45_04410 [candidate division KSB3 bacterium]|uniref:Type 4 fimbrial biogenesis protein PilX N-terminal domain-containing protein n=1 Tax=candidate division KSB3 bacterium TaxID=2044937 RepID=A0A2G6E8B5_9BACT|nr:MAG: hypothetical protein CSB45_04410 [candidate division KSB3 bacterium]PIE30620.1 MAG: hypothetical protein CSA57_02995 [candidate division KSB3 bacterium]